MVEEKECLTDEQAVKVLNKLFTRQLLAMLDETRPCGVMCCCETDWKYVSNDQIKAVLSTREHIPNKMEGVGKRKQKAKNAKAYRRTKGAR
jgi:hypothetical protein